MSERDIFTAARQMTDPAARSAYLNQACADPAQRERVAALLRAHEQPNSLLDVPAAAPLDTGAATGAHPGPGLVASSEGLDALTFLAPPGRPDALGRIGHYEVLGVLGHGGFGIVFRAFDDVLERVVAVKVLASHLAATSPARKRFLREARASAQVRHENVVQVHAIEEQPLPYLVMEFIPGETLQERLDRTGPLEVAEVLRIGRQIAEGLAAAHVTGLIHRDVKPANVMIESGPHARVKLTDFGLARAADDARISQSGVVAGTPLYMAPEQARGEALDHRADLFSLGSVLYVMCTGRAPFRAGSTFAVLKRVAEDEPRPIREVIPEVPEWLCRVVAKLHAKEPAARFQSARAVAEILADCESQLQQHGALRDLARIPAGQPRPRHRAWIAGILALVLLVGGALWVGSAALHYLSNTSAPEHPPVVHALRDLVVAKEAARDTARTRSAVGMYSRVEVVNAEIELTEARIRLAQAEGNQEAVPALLEQLVSQRQEQRQLTALRVQAGSLVPDVLNDVDARLKEAKARLEQARSR